MFKPTFNDISSFENLMQAYRTAKKCMENRTEIEEFALDAGINIAILQNQLNAGSYRIMPYSRFEVCDSKRRTIHALAFRDRVVQHSLCDNVLRPIIDARLIYDNTACRQEKGTHFAMNRLKLFMREHFKRHSNIGWVLKCDIYHFFQSIPHAVLKQKIAKLPFDARTHKLLNYIIDSYREVGEGVIQIGEEASANSAKPNVKGEFSLIGEDARAKVAKTAHIPSTTQNPTNPRGIPLGNQSSQWFALYYLDSLDRLVKEKLQVRAYVRYMDDCILIHESHAYLKKCLCAMTEELNKLGLRFNPKTQLVPLEQGIDFLGWHFSMSVTEKINMRLKQKSKRRMFNTVAETLIYEEKSSKAVMDSYVGHLSHGNAKGLERYVKDALDTPCPNNQFFESVTTEHGEQTFAGLKQAEQMFANPKQLNLTPNVDAINLIHLRDNAHQWVNYINTSAQKGYLCAITTGAYNKRTNKCTWAATLYLPNMTQTSIHGTNTNENLSSYGSVSGELSAVLHVCKWAQDRGLTRIKIFHAHDGTQKWLTGAWRAKSAVSKTYVKCYEQMFAPQNTKSGSRGAKDAPSTQKPQTSTGKVPLHVTFIQIHSKMIGIINAKAKELAEIESGMKK